MAGTNKAPGPVGFVSSDAYGNVTAVVADANAANNYGPAKSDPNATAYANTDGTYTVVYTPTPIQTGSSAPTVRKSLTPAKPKPVVPPTSPVSFDITNKLPAQPSATVTGSSAPTVTPSTVATQPAAKNGNALNTPVPDADKIAALVLADGVPIGPPINYEVMMGNNRQADKFYLELSLGLLPENYRAAYWSDGTQKKIEIQVGYVSQSSVALIIGMIDESDVDIIHGIVKLRGRDLTGQLIDNKSSQKYANKTSSQIAAIIANKYGLTADIDMTTTLIGAYYQREHAQLTDETTEHDLLCYLADQEGFNYWIHLNTLHFRGAEPPTSDAFQINCTAAPNGLLVGNVIDLVLTRSETLAKDIVVKVISWNMKKKAQIVVTVRRTATRSSGKSTKQTTEALSSAQTYVVRKPNLTKDQATQYGQQKAREFSSHERKIEATMPPDFFLSPRTQIMLSGTGTAYDMNYYIDTIEHSGDWQSGANMVIHAKNHSPQSETTV